MVSTLVQQWDKIHVRWVFWFFQIREGLGPAMQVKATLPPASERDSAHPVNCPWMVGCFVRQLSGRRDGGEFGDADSRAFGREIGEFPIRFLLLKWKLEKRREHQANNKMEVQELRPSKAGTMTRDERKEQKVMPRGRIELPSKDYPSHAWSFRWPIWDLRTSRYTIEAWCKFLRGSKIYTADKAVFPCTSSEQTLTVCPSAAIASLLHNKLTIYLLAVLVMIARNSKYMWVALGCDQKQYDCAEWLSKMLVTLLNMRIYSQLHTACSPIFSNTL